MFDIIVKENEEKPKYLAHQVSSTSGAIQVF